jgi:streptogramin lyase
MSYVATRFGALGTGTDKWYGGCADGNGYGWWVSRTAARGILRLDLSDGSATTYTQSEADQIGLTLAGDGYLYSVGGGGGDSKCLKIDPSDGSATTVGADIVNNRYRDVIAAPNGDVYLIPSNGTAVGKIDTSAGTISTFGSVAAGNNKYYTAVLVGTDIYCIPLTATAILKIDTTADTVSTFGSLGAGDKWWGAVLVGTDIYCMPWDATEILKIDTTTDTTSTFGSFSGSDQYAGAVVFDGKVIGIPAAATACLLIDPADDSVSTFGGFGSVAGKWRHHQVVGDDAVWCAPGNDTDILRITESMWSVGFVRIGA